MVIPGIQAPLQRRADAAAAWLDERRDAGDTVAVVHHIDADGVSAGAVAQRALERAAIPHRMVAAKSLDEVHIDQVRQGGHDALWFCDFGSTAYMHFLGTPRLVCDHHQLVRDGTEEDFAHLNPLLDDIPGEMISGSGCAFLAAVAHDEANMDLLPVALVGAAGDMQDRDGGFDGANQAILEAGIAAGLLEARDDLAWFGTETRPLRKFLAYGDEPKVPGLSNDRRGAEALLRDLDIPLEVDGRERCYADLDDEERLRLRSAVVGRLLDCAMPPDGLWRQVVRIPAEGSGPTRELREFGTLLNSTARYDEPAIGLAVAAGDRDKAYQEALGLRDGHKANLVKSLDAFRRHGIRETAALQWVHLQGDVLDTVVGIVCGMALNGLGLRRDRPLVGFAHTPDGRSKVSARAPSELAGRIDLATGMREAAAAVGGQGGGHKGAAGATIPRGSEPHFRDVLDGIVAGQLGIDVPVAPVDGSADASATRAATATVDAPTGTPTPPDAPTVDPAPPSDAPTAAAAGPDAPAKWGHRPGQTRLL